MELTERSLDRMAELAGDAFRRVGSLRLAFGEAERDALRREHDALREDGFAVEWVGELAPPARPALPGRDPPRTGRRAAARALGAATRRARGRRRSGHARG